MEVNYWSIAGFRLFFLKKPSSYSRYNQRKKYPTSQKSGEIEYISPSIGASPPETLGEDRVCNSKNSYYMNLVFRLLFNSSVRRAKTVFRHLYLNIYLLFKKKFTRLCPDLDRTQIQLYIFKSFIFNGEKPFSSERHYWRPIISGDLREIYHNVRGENRGLVR